MAGILFALASALSWGAGDFFGGLAARKISQFQVLLLTTSGSLLLLVVFALAGQEPWPGVRDVVVAVAAGLSGALGLAALYRGLSLGNAALVAPVAGVVGAVIPTVVGLFVEGLPGGLVLGGYGLSAAGIWLVSRPKEAGDPGTRDGLGPALLAGLGFGGFLALIAQVESEAVFTPLVFAKSASLVLALVLLRVRRERLVGPAGSPVALLSGFLDAGGNVLYLYATQYTRLDIAALLSSLYPAATVLLAGVVLKERLSKPQWAGVGMCIAAILMMTG